MSTVQAIFESDFSFVQTKTAWKSVNAATEFKLRIRPLTEELKAKVGISLHVKLPKTYPKAPPTISLEDPQGLNASDIPILLSQLQEQIKELSGEPSVFQLAESAAEFIDRHNGIIGDAAQTKHQSLNAAKDLRQKNALELEKERERAANAAKRAQELEERERLAAQVEQDRQRMQQAHAANPDEDHARRAKAALRHLSDGSDGRFYLRLPNQPVGDYTVLRGAFALICQADQST